jgi:prefoldin subunit 5
VNAAAGKRSKAALKAFLAEDNDGTDVAAADPRAAELRSLGAEDRVALEAIREVFAGTDLPDDQEKVRRILRTRSEIQKEWADVRDSFLAIGRALISLENELTKAEFARLRHGTERLFPFSDATATQLRQITRAVDGGRIPADACPGSYGTAYQITLLTESQLRVAWERGLIRPNVTRREIMQLRREVPVDGAKPPPGRIDRARLREELDRLSERRIRLAEELAMVEQRIAQLDELLSPVIDGEAEAAA